MTVKVIRWIQLAGNLFAAGTGTAFHSDIPPLQHLRVIVVEAALPLLSTTISVSMVEVVVLYFFSNISPFRHEGINIYCITIIIVI